jgi:hypothetical protein
MTLNKTFITIYVNIMATPIFFIIFAPASRIAFLQYQPIFQDTVVYMWNIRSNELRKPQFFYHFWT